MLMSIKWLLQDLLLSKNKNMYPITKPKLSSLRQRCLKRLNHKFQWALLSLVVLLSCLCLRILFQPPNPSIKPNRRCLCLRNHKNRFNQRYKKWKKTRANYLWIKWCSGWKRTDRKSWRKKSGSSSKPQLIKAMIKMMTMGKNMGTKVTVRKITMTKSSLSSKISLQCSTLWWVWWILPCRKQELIQAC